MLLFFDYVLSDIKFINITCEDRIVQVAFTNVDTHLSSFHNTSIIILKTSSDKFSVCCQMFSSRPVLSQKSKIKVWNGEVRPK